MKRIGLKLYRRNYRFPAFAMGFILMVSSLCVLPSKAYAAALGTNLIVNGNAEGDIGGWDVTDTIIEGAWCVVTAAGLGGVNDSQNSGKIFDYYPNLWSYLQGVGTLSQVIDISSWSANIDLRKISLRLQGETLKKYSESHAVIKLELLGVGGDLIKSYEVENDAKSVADDFELPKWQINTIDIANLPMGTRRLRVTLIANIVSTGAYRNDFIEFDGIDLKLSFDTTPPTGYSASVDQTFINNACKEKLSFTLNGAEVGSTYDYIVSSDGGGTNITGTGVVATSGQQITGIDVSRLGDGKLTLSVKLTDVAGNEGGMFSCYVTKDIVAPTGYSAVIDQANITTGNEDALSFTMSGAEIGSTYYYNLSSSAGGTPITGSGIVTMVDQTVTGINVSALSDGILTLSVTLTDSAENAGTAVTDTVVKDTDSTAPTVVALSPANNAVDIETASNFTITFSEPVKIGTGNITLKKASDGSNAEVIDVTGSQVNGSGSTTITINPNTTLEEETKYYIVIDHTAFTDLALANNGYAGISTDNVWCFTTKDMTPPTGYSAVIDQANITAGNEDALSFTMSGAEIGSTYNYILSSSAGGTPITGSGTVTMVDQTVTGISVSTLGDGTLTLSVTLTDGAGNVGTAVTTTVVKDTDSTAPTAVTLSPANNAVDIETDSNFIITFSEPVKMGTGNITLKKASDGSNAEVIDVTGSQVSGSGSTTITINPNTTLEENIKYYITIDNIAFTDLSLAGNSYAGISADDVWCFTTKDDITPPTGYSVAINQTIIDYTNEHNLSFVIEGAEIGSTYDYILLSSGGGTTADSGTVTVSREQVLNIDVSGLNDGILTLSVTLTDIRGNAGLPATDTVTKNTIIPIKTYAIEAIGDQIMTVQTEGYTSGTQETKTINIVKTGTGDLIHLAVTLGGTHKDAFSIAPLIIDTLNDTVTSSVFTIKAKDGLLQGLYSAVVIVSADTMTDVSFNVQQQVVSAIPEPPTIPVPSPPINIRAAAGNGEAIISFDSPVSNGGSPIISYTVTSHPGGKITSGTASPITVSGLTNGTLYNFTVTAANAAGISIASELSNSIQPSNGSGGGSGGSGGGGGISPPTPPNNEVAIEVNGKVEAAATIVSTKKDNQTISTIIVNNKKINEKLEREGQNAIITISVNVSSDVVSTELDGDMIKSMEIKEAIIVIKTEMATYTLPASQINIDAIAQQIGKQVRLQDIKISIEIIKQEAKTVKRVEDAVNKRQGTIIAAPVEFNIICTYEGQTVSVTRFNNYVERTIVLPKGTERNGITTGIVINPDNTLRHVPTKVDEVDGRYYARINSLTNSIYAVIRHSVSFSDVEKHWAKDAINDMASRMIISGVGNDKFDPDRDVTRAEFAALIVKALGLKPQAVTNLFSDVKSADWFGDSVETAAQYHIIAGYGNGKFGPMDKITREQAMSMIARAMNTTGFKVEIEQEEIQKLLKTFGDAAKASEYAKFSIATCIKAGIVSSKEGNMGEVKGNITRAEVAVIIRKLLQKSDLI